MPPAYHSVMLLPINKGTKRISRKQKGRGENKAMWGMGGQWLWSSYNRAYATVASKKNFIQRCQISKQTIWKEPNRETKAASKSSHVIHVETITQNWKNAPLATTCTDTTKIPRMLYSSPRIAQPYLGPDQKYHLLDPQQLFLQKMLLASYQGRC